MGIEQLLSVVIYIVVAGLVFWLIWWFVGYCGLPEPFNKVARVLIGVAALIFLLYFVMGMMPPMPRLR